MLAETDRGAAPRISYLVVLLGTAAYVVSCFLPYFEVELGDRNESFGTLLRASALRRSTLPQGPSLDVGFRVQAAGVLVVILGTMALLVTARRAAMGEPQPSLGP